jgi:predicted phage replisome organizer
MKWIKLAIDIFEDEKIFFIESMPNGDNIIIIWLKLLCLAGKQLNKGVLTFNGLPYTAKMLSMIFRRDEQTIQTALDTFERFGMITTVNGVITITNWLKHQNLDKIEANNEYMKNYMRERRAEQKALAEGKVNEKLNGKTKPAEGQEKAFKAVQAFTFKFIDKHIDGKTSVGLLLVGGVGSGKTFMVSSVVNEIIDFNFERLTENHVRFVSVTDLMNQLRDFISNEWNYHFSETISTLQETDLLILDDLGAEKASDWTREKLFEIIDYRYSEGLPMLVTTNCTPDELKKKIGDRNFDRLREMCALVPVTSKSQRITATPDAYME